MRQRGFTLTELLVVITIIGLVAAIAVPNMISALHRARQKRTMSDLRAISEGIEMYQQDFSFYPTYTDTMAEALAGDLEVYVGKIVSKDAWRWPLHYDSDGDGYTVKSYGSDGLEDAAVFLGPTDNFRSDIIFSDGLFSQWPEGVQH